MKNSSFYFPHDFNARNDIKIQALLHDFKSKGYGLYWVIVEMLHEASEHKMPLKPYTFIAIAQQSNETPEAVEKFIYACINKYDLLIDLDGFIQSNRVNTNILRREEISNKRASAGKQGANAKQMLANAQQNQAKERKGKENKGKEINIPFETFWDLYNKKEDRRKSQDKWVALSDNERQEIINSLPAYIAATPDPKYRKNPLTFFNNRSWEDEGFKQRASTATLSILRAVTVNENDQVVYENGKIYGISQVSDLLAYRNGEVSISVFDRKIS
jgi:hypothetical protein